MSADSAMLVAGGIVAVVVFLLFFANICDMIDGERPPRWEDDVRPKDCPPPSGDPS